MKMEGPFGISLDSFDPNYDQDCIFQIKDDNIPRVNYNGSLTPLTNIILFYNPYYKRLKLLSNKHYNL